MDLPSGSAAVPFGPAASEFTSENQLEGKLALSRRGCSTDGAERRIIRRYVRKAKIRVIQSVKEFPTDLNAETIAGGECSDDRDIEIRQARRLDDTASRIAETIRRSGGATRGPQQKCFSVEPLLRSMGSITVWIGYHIRPVRRAAAVAEIT